MAVQRWTIAKLAGVSGDRAFREIQRWSLAERAANERDEYLSDTQKAEVSDFVNALREHGHELPTVFFAEFIDYWTVGLAMLRYFRELDYLVVVENAAFSLVACQLPDGGKLKLQLQKALRSVTRSRMDEKRLFMLFLLEALRAYEELIDYTTIVLVRHSWDGSPSDEEILKEAQVLAPWLKDTTS